MSVIVLSRVLCGHVYTAQDRGRPTQPPQHLDTECAVAFGSEYEENWEFPSPGVFGGLGLGTSPDSRL